MKLRFGRTRSQQPHPPVDPDRFHHLPERVDQKDLRTSYPASAARDPEGGQDTDRDFVIRYGDPFDDA